MTAQYNIETYTRGVNSFGIKFPDTIYSAVLTASTNAAVTVPGATALGLATNTSKNKFIAIINWSYDTDLYFSVNHTAAIPGAVPIAAGNSILLNHFENAFLVNAGDTLNFISAGTPGVTIAFYAVVE